MPNTAVASYRFVMSTPAPPDLIVGLACAHLGARALHVIADLGAADAIATEPRTADDLARDAGVDPDILDRLLRLLEIHGLFTCDETGRWDHTDPSRWLRSDHPMSLRPFARMTGLPLSWGSFTALDHTLRTGEPGMLTLDPAGIFLHALESLAQGRAWLPEPA